MPVSTGSLCRWHHKEDQNVSQACPGLCHEPNVLPSSLLKPNGWTKATAPWEAPIESKTLLFLHQFYESNHTKPSMRIINDQSSSSNKNVCPASTSGVPSVCPGSQANFPISTSIFSSLRIFRACNENTGLACFLSSPRDWAVSLVFPNCQDHSV